MDRTHCGSDRNSNSSNSPEKKTLHVAQSFSRKRNTKVEHKRIARIICVD